MVYNALIRSHLDYMLPVWGACKKDILSKIKCKQKRAVQLVCGIRDNMEHSSPLFKGCGFLKLEDMYKLSALKFSFKSQTQELPIFEKRHNVNTRENVRNNLSLPDVIPSSQRRMPLICLPQVWNSASEQIKSATSKKNISSHVYLEYLSSY